jgi:D-alanyl-D-alanine carboxypeptidase
VALAFVAVLIVVGTIGPGSPGLASAGRDPGPAGGAGGTAGANPSSAPAGALAAPTASPVPEPPDSRWLQLAVVPTPPVDLSAALTAALAKLRQKAGIPGISATILWPDGRSWTAVSGFASVSSGVRVTRTTPFPVASVSKTFLAVLVVQLSQEGRFGLDDPLVTWLPAAAVNPTVTIRELLDHTSGIYDFFNNPKIDKALLGCRGCPWTPAKALSYVKKAYFPPGTNWAYSNTNYVLLGQLVEAVTGQTYVTLLRQRFFDPLGLTSTYVQGAEPARGTTIVHSYRFFTTSVKEKPTSLWDGTGISPFRSVVTAAGSAGAVASTSWDLAHWAQALYSGQLLAPPAFSQMLDFAPALATRSAVPYGLGVQEYTISGRTAYGHGGRLLGARSAIRYLPSAGISIAIVMNTDRGDPAAIAKSLLDIVLPPLPPPPPSPSPTPTFSLLPSGQPSPDPIPVPVAGASGAPSLP